MASGNNNGEIDLSWKGKEGLTLGIQKQHLPARGAMKGQAETISIGINGQLDTANVKPIDSARY
jgi:hypothetical protein